MSRSSKSNGYSTSGVLGRNDRKVRSILNKLRRNGIVIYPENHQAVVMKLFDIATLNRLATTQVNGAFVIVDTDKCGRFTYGK